MQIEKGLYRTIKNNKSTFAPNLKFIWIGDKYLIPLNIYYRIKNLHITLWIKKITTR